MDFADKMRSVDPSIKLIAVGELGNWDKTILRNCSDEMDYISEHFYKQDYHGGGLMTHVNQIPDAIRGQGCCSQRVQEINICSQGKRYKNLYGRMELLVWSSDLWRTRHEIFLQGCHGYCCRNE